MNSDQMKVQGTLLDIVEYFYFTLRYNTRELAKLIQCFNFVSLSIRVSYIIIIIIIKTLFHEGKNTLQPGAEKLVAL